MLAAAQGRTPYEFGAAREIDVPEWQRDSLLGKDRKVCLASPAHFVVRAARLHPRRLKRLRGYPRRTMARLLECSGLTEPSIIRGIEAEMAQLCPSSVFTECAAVLAVSSRQRFEFMDAVVPLRMEGSVKPEHSRMSPPTFRIGAHNGSGRCRTPRCQYSRSSVMRAYR